MGELEPKTPQGESQPDKEKMPKALFELGQIVVTTGAVGVLKEVERHPVQLLARPPPHGAE